MIGVTALVCYAASEALAFVHVLTGEKQTLSPNFRRRVCAAVHATYFDGVQIIPEMKGPNRATLQYVGFSGNHRIMGFVILGFFRKALDTSGAKKVDVHFTVPIEAGEKFCEIALGGNQEKRRQ